MISLRAAHVILVAAVSVCGLGAGGAASAQTPRWLDSLGYSPSQVFPIRVGANHFPYVPVRINSTELWLLFDTGNMAGLTVATQDYEQLGLPQIGSVRRRDSEGTLLGVFRIGEAERVVVLGHTATDVAVREFGHPTLAGLVGPDDLPGTRFTLDYRAGTIAVANEESEWARGRRVLQMLYSAQHPRLILVEGTFRGKPVVIELDTGKSRTVVDPRWAASVGLTVGPADTVMVGVVRMGDATFDIRNAKPVGLGGIDPNLPSPLVLSLGSDTLSRFVLTVDYTQRLVHLSEAW